MIRVARRGDSSRSDFALLPANKPHCQPERKQVRDTNWHDKQQGGLTFVGYGTQLLDRCSSLTIGPLVTIAFCTCKASGSAGTVSTDVPLCR